jgi:hypothetical protein
MAKRRRRDNTMAKGRRTDNAMVVVFYSVLQKMIMTMDAKLK